MNGTAGGGRSNRAQRLKARQYSVLVEIAGVRHHKEMPLAALSPEKLGAFGSALRARLTDREGGFSKHCLHEFVSEIRFDSKKVTMQGESDAAGCSYRA